MACPAGMAQFKCEIDFLRFLSSSHLRQGFDFPNPTVWLVDVSFLGGSGPSELISDLMICHAVDWCLRDQIFELTGSFSEFLVSSESPVSVRALRTLCTTTLMRNIAVRGKLISICET